MTEQHEKEAPLWANWIGIMAIVFGILLAAVQGTELTRTYVLQPGSAATLDKPPRCPEYDLEKDGLSVEYCHAMADGIKSRILTTPDWFRSLQGTVACITIIIALGSVLVGIALIDNRAWALNAAVIIFSGLIISDLVLFVAAYNAGPVVRDLYLWNLIVWIVIHLMLAAATIAGYHEEKLAAG
ncbi:MAG: hypothetical protein MI673_04875 [Thiotrichales bacterium]|nr:hypothetical protein [Thiotrichales bacterium]